MDKIKFIIILVIVAVAAVALYLYFSATKNPVVPNTYTAPTATVPTTTSTPQAPSTQTLGGQIYDKSSNPIQGKVPTVNPVTNPVQGLYKNPLE